MVMPPPGELVGDASPRTIPPGGITIATPGASPTGTPSSTTPPAPRELPSMETKSLVEALSRPDAYAREPARVDVLHTHISVLFFLDDRVYKVKKPVDLGFVDYSSLERRRFFCEEEVRLNRRLTERVHLGVVPIAQGADGTVRVGGQGTVIEWAVEMVRLDSARMLDALLEAGEVDNEKMDALASLLAQFHARADTGAGVDEHGAPDAVRALVLENLDEIAPFVATGLEEVGAGEQTLSAPLLRFLRRRARAFLDEEGELLARRVSEGRIRDGHGDLHAGNICFGTAGIDVYDCIEFSRRFRCSDVACDLAFLAMDLDFRGYPGFAGYLAHRYVALARDPELQRCLRFYKGYRAAVRGKVASLTAVDLALDADQRDEKRRLAMRYFHLAAAYELPPAVVLMCGLPASGKSWLARRIAESFHAVLLQSDVRRKILAGLPTEARAGADYGAALYSAARKEETYRSLLEKTVEALRNGRTVVVDATFAQRAWRAPVLPVAAELGPACFGLHVDAPEAVILARLEARASEPRTSSSSDADAAVYRRAKQEFEPPVEVPAPRAVEVSGEGAAEVAVSRAVDAAIAVAG